MELKEGLYVRTKDGFIDKIINDYKGCCNSPHCNCKHVSCEHNYYDEENIIKVSDNIIDLVEVGDYVNGYLVLDFETLQNREKAISVNALDSYGWGQGVIPVNEIKSIVTKEQFALMKYEVE